MLEDEPERPSPRMQQERWAKSPIPCVLALSGSALVVVLIVLVGWVLLRASAPGLSQAEASGTAEAMRFATAQAERRATREAVRATGTAVIRGTATAAASQTSAAATTVAQATAEAPPTLTAEARAFETARAKAEATVQVLDARATLVYGPSDGMLEQVEGGELPCAAAGLNLREFVAEATFHNPSDMGFEEVHAWDYGLVFSNVGEGSEYRVILDSEGSWTFNLHSDAYDVSFSDITDLLDLSRRGSNTLKLYVTGDAAHIYLNGRYIDTLDLVMLGLGQSERATHDIFVCGSMREGYAAVGSFTVYEGFKVWTVP